MKKFSNIINVFKKHGCGDHKFIKPKSIVVSQWVRMKCMFGCAGYGKSLSCPPNTPTIIECREFFSEFKDAVMFHFTTKVDKPGDRKFWSEKINEDLLAVEREVFLQGYYKAFMLLINECRQCAICSGKKELCPRPNTLRPMPEALGVDIFTTARNNGYPIDVLKNYEEPMNRYAILMIQ